MSKWHFCGSPGIRRRPQPDAAVGLHAERDVGEHRVVVVVGQLLVGVVGEVVALRGAELALALLQRDAQPAQVVEVRRRVEFPELEVGAEALERALRLAAVVRPRPAARHQHARVPGFVEVELATAVVLVHRRQRLRVHVRQVVALVEVVLHALPVEVADDGDPVRATHVLHPVRVEVLGDRVEPLAQRGRIGIHVEPDEPGPRVGRDLDEVAHPARAAVDEVVLVGHPVEATVDAEPPTVVRTLELPAEQRADLGRDQPVAAVLADVEEHAHRVVHASDGDHRIASDLVGDVVARARAPGRRAPRPATRVATAPLPPIGRTRATSSARRESCWCSRSAREPCLAASHESPPVVR